MEKALNTLIKSSPIVITVGCTLGISFYVYRTAKLFVENGYTKIAVKSKELSLEASK